MEVRPDRSNETYFAQAVVVSIIRYGYTRWTLTKRMEKKLDGNYTRMLWAILNKSWRQLSTKQQLYGHLPSITKPIQVRRTRHEGHCWRSRDELISNVLLWTPSHGRAKDVQLGPAYNSSVLIQDVALKTYQKRWTVERGGGWGLGSSVLMTRHDDDEEDIYSIPYCRLMQLQV